MQKGNIVSAYDLVDRFNVDSATANTLLHRFENRRSSKGQNNMIPFASNLIINDNNNNNNNNNMNQNPYNNNNNFNNNINNNYTTNNVVLFESAQFIPPQYSNDANPYHSDANRKNSNPYKLNNNNNGNHSYQNKSQQQHSQSQPPPPPPPPPSGVSPLVSNVSDPNELPMGWAKLQDAQGIFYINVVTQEKRRTRPNMNEAVNLDTVERNVTPPKMPVVPPIKSGMDHLNLNANNNNNNNNDMNQIDTISEMTGVTLTNPDYNNGSPNNNNNNNNSNNNQNNRDSYQRYSNYNNNNNNASNRNARGVSHASYHPNKSNLKPKDAPVHRRQETVLDQV